MATGGSPKSLEESIEYPRGAVPKLSALTKQALPPESPTSELSASSPPTFESCVVMASPNKSRRSLTRSLPRTSTETSPLIPRDEELQVNLEVEPNCTNCSNTCYNCYKYYAKKLRNSALIHVIQALTFSIPISAIVIGILYRDKCPKALLLPGLGALLGMVELVFLSLWSMMTFLHRREIPPTPLQKLSFGIFCFFMAVSSIVDAIFVFSMSPSFDPSSEDYCNETFYEYAFAKEIVTAVAVFLCAMIYIPGSRHCFCCENCVMRAPPIAFHSGF